MQIHQQVTVIAALTLCVGCNSSPETVRLQGTVTFDGRPIEKGKIDFLPNDGVTGGAVSANIVGGRYEFPPKASLLASGVYTVRILGLRKTGRTEPNRVDRGGPPIELEENFVPPNYNTASELKVRIADLPDRNKADFAIGATSPTSVR